MEAVRAGVRSPEEPGARIAERGTAYAPLPKWRRHAKRASCLDLVTLLRKEMAEQPKLVQDLRLQPSYLGLTAAADA